MCEKIKSYLIFRNTTNSILFLFFIIWNMLLQIIVSCIQIFINIHSQKIIYWITGKSLGKYIHIYFSLHVCWSRFYVNCTSYLQSYSLMPDTPFAHRKVLNTETERTNKRTSTRTQAHVFIQFYNTQMLKTHHSTLSIQLFFLMFVFLHSFKSVPILIMVFIITIKDNVCFSTGEGECTIHAILDTCIYTIQEY